MNLTMISAPALICAPDARTHAPYQAPGTAPFGLGIDGTSVSRVRTLDGVDRGKVGDTAQGPAARGTPL